MSIIKGGKGSYADFDDLDYDHQFNPEREAFHKLMRPIPGPGYEQIKTGFTHDSHPAPEASRPLSHVSDGSFFDERKTEQRLQELAPAEEVQTWDDDSIARATERAQTAYVAKAYKDVTADLEGPYGRPEPTAAVVGELEWPCSSDTFSVTLYGRGPYPLVVPAAVARSLRADGDTGEGRNWIERAGSIPVHPNEDAFDLRPGGINGWFRSPEEVAGMYAELRQTTGANPLEDMTDAERKAHPIGSGFLDYFPDAALAVAHVSHVANEQHNPGEPMHWARSKSTDEYNTAQRHLMQRGTVDKDGLRHTAKAAWRIMAMLQKELEEAGEGTFPRGARP